MRACRDFDGRYYKAIGHEPTLTTGPALPTEFAALDASQHNLFNLKNVKITNNPNAD